MTEVRAKKALGQHFLTDLSIARRIVDALGAAPCPEGSSEPCLVESAAKAGAGEPSERGIEGPGAKAGADETSANSPAGVPSEKTSVLEIGPGMGVLTRYLLERQDIDLKLVELDGESVNYLMNRYGNLAGRLLQADYLKLDIHKVFGGRYSVIGNFPYNISSQIFFKILDDRERVPEVVCMVQKEVAQRIAERPGSKTYGILSVLLQAWYDIEYLFTVEPGAFAPPPKVRSAVIRLRRNGRTALIASEAAEGRLPEASGSAFSERAAENGQALMGKTQPAAEVSEAKFRSVVKTAFGQRRKTLRNALKPLLSDLSAVPEEILALRAEQLGVQDFIDLTARIFPL